MRKGTLVGEHVAALPDTEMLGVLLRETFDYFKHEVNFENGLIFDSTQPNSPSSIAVMGLGLGVYVVASERGMISRDEAVKRTLVALRFLYSGHQGPEDDATGYKGFYYHFLDRKTGRRTWNCELSTIDTAIFVAGALTSAEYFSRDDKFELEIRTLADAIYSRIDWQWALNGKTSFSHGWRPETGFLPNRWDRGYNEAHILYILALGSPTFPIDAVGYKNWISTFELKTIYNINYIYAAPLFIHQMSQVWLDFRGIRDDLTRQLGFDYFENSHRATHVQRHYAVSNPMNYVGYNQYCWGITAGDGPGPIEEVVDGRSRYFYGYAARGAPFGIDDGTISPWAVVSSLPFAPEIAICTIRHAIERLKVNQRESGYGFDASFNVSFSAVGSEGDAKRGGNTNGWVSPWHYGLNQGPSVIMIENHLSGLIWKTIGKSRYIIEGLKRAGFFPHRD